MPENTTNTIEIGEAKPAQTAIAKLLNDDPVAGIIEVSRRQEEILRRLDKIEAQEIEPEAEKTSGQHLKELLSKDLFAAIELMIDQVEFADDAMKDQDHAIQSLGVSMRKIYVAVLELQKQFEVPDYAKAKEYYVQHVTSIFERSFPEVLDVAPLVCDRLDDIAEEAMSSNMDAAERFYELAVLAGFEPIFSDRSKSERLSQPEKTSVN